MTAPIRICPLIDLQMSSGTILRAQNYFIGQDYGYNGKTYRFLGFQVSGSLSVLGGDNETFSLRMPNEEMILRLVEEGDSNRNSQLTITNLWLTPAGSVLPSPISDHYVGVSGAYDELAIELRFRSAMDAVSASIPRRILTAENVGVLPLAAEINLSR